MIHVEQYHHYGAMELADALIAATCMNNSELLITRNEKHYKAVPNLQMRKFVP